MLPLSPKEQILLVPKALLTLNQAIRSVRTPLPPAEQNKPDEDTEVEAPPVNYAALVQLVSNFENQRKAHDRLRNGKNSYAITPETDRAKNDMKESSGETQSPITP